MFRINIGARYRLSLRQAVILLGLLVQTSELLLPSIAHAQTSSLGPAYSFSETTLVISNYSSGNYSTFNAALSAARAKFIADTRSPTSQCPLEVAVFTYSGQTAQARIDYSGPNDALSCGNGAGYGVTYVLASNVNYDLGKNAGDCACDGGNGHKSGPAPGTPLKGEPINIATGNKFEQDTDYVAPTSWLTFRRFYNGLVAVDPTTLGTTWRHSFDRSLKFASSVSIRAYRPDGRFEKFSKSNTGAWTPDADIADSLIQESDANGNATGYTVFVAASQQFEQYSATGLLLSIKDEAGQVMTLTYSTTSTSVSIAPAPNLLLTVTDPNGRVLQFTYDSSARLHTVTQPDSGVLTYGYDAATGDLTSVQYPDGKIRQYAYNEASLTGGANLPGVLTGVIDEAGARYASTTYDSTGRATSASLAGGVDAMTVTYGTSTGTTPTTITTALGVSTSLGFQNILGALKVAGSSQACGASCNQPWQATTYDANGYLTSSTDFNGNITQTTYDANGLLDQQIDASGTTNQRTTTTTWNTTLRVPLTQTVQNNNGVTAASTAWVYNARGQATARCEIDPTVSAAASYTCGSAANAPTGVRQTRTTYCDAVDTTQCPLIGLLLTRTGPRTDLTQTTSYAYYLDDTSTHRHGDLKSVTDALGHVTTLASYDGAGRITRTIDPNSSVTDYTYTPRGLLASRTVRFNPDGNADTYNDATTKISYTAYGAVQTIRDADGVKITYGYDAAHRLTTITDALGNVLQYTLDASGNRTAEKTFATGSSTPSRTLTRTFNTLGQLIQVVDGLNHTVFDASASGSYDGNGNLLQSGDANGIVRQQSYDALNRLVQSIDNLNGADTATRNTITTQGWDALDRLTKVTDPSNLTTTYGYDGLSNPISLSSPDSGTSQASFDAAGNMLSRTDANGITVSHSYDALDRRLSDSYADSTLNASYHYDDPDSVVSCSSPDAPANPIGHLTRIVESTVTTTRCYDRNDRLAQQTQLTAGHTDSTEFYFSLAGRLGGRIAPDKVGAFYNYDNAGRVVNVTIPPGALSNGSSPVQQITYLPFGPMTSYRIHRQIITRSYDANYALTDITSAALNLHFARDPLGNIIAEGNTAGASPAVESYSYDPLNQLKAITQGSTTVESLSYNPTGDRLSKASGGLATGAYGYDAGTHHLSSIGSAARSYDTNGNTTGANSAGQTWGYGYNGRNRMTLVQANGATVGTYIYNALGQRIQKTTTAPTATTQRYFYDEQSHLIGEYTVGGNNRDTIWLGDMPVATVDTTGSTSVVNLVIGDGLGTPRAVVNDAGTTIWSWAYVGNPFGEQQPTSTTGYVLNLRFPGQYYDAESGLMYNGARYYESATGRFIQPDPSGFRGGIGLYVYGLNSPLMYIDPTGLSSPGSHAPMGPFTPIEPPFLISPMPTYMDILRMTSNDDENQGSVDAVLQLKDQFGDPIQAKGYKVKEHLICNGKILRSNQIDWFSMTLGTVIDNHTTADMNDRIANSSYITDQTFSIFGFEWRFSGSKYVDANQDSIY